MKYKYVLIDAYTKQAFNGAPIAVFTHADMISEENRINLAKEMNLAETVFVCTSNHASCLAKLDILKKHVDTAFSSHAVIAACYAMVEEGVMSGSQEKVEVDGNIIDVVIGVKNKKVQVSIPVAEKYDEYVPANKELSEIVGIKENEIGCLSYKPMIVTCADSFLIVPVKNEQTLRAAKFNENKWQMSFVASLAKQVLLISSEHAYDNVNFVAKLLGKNFTADEDPPVGTAMPSLGLYLSYGISDYHRTSLIQRGDKNSRISILEINIDKKGDKVKSITLGGYALKMAEGYFDLVD